jgi:hypothetical protein
MAGTPRWKLYNPQGGYVAACKHLEDAACLVALYGTGATIRDGHSKADVVWTEGAEAFPAGESYDRVAQVAEDRRRKRAESAYIRAHGALPSGYTA